MNPNKNYNGYRWSCVELVTPIPHKKFPNIMLSHVPRRSKQEKTRDANRHKIEGTEENIVGYCSLCDLPRPFVSKPRSNVHYNCLKIDCCVMLHQWDICEHCMIYKHGPKVKYDDKSRLDEVARFHQVFSQLPDDVKKYVGEYVPNIFKYVERITSLVFIDRKLATLDKYVTQPKSKWSAVASLMTKKYVLKNKVNKSSSRKQICAGVQELYKNVYVAYTKSMIEESDFWTHKSMYSQRRHYDCEHINELETIKSIL
jgi:hypothetical protein